MCVHWAGGGSAPSTPAQRYGGAAPGFRGAVDAAVAGSRRQDDERRAIPRRPAATVAPGRQPAGAGPPLRSGPTGDCRGRPCRKALAGQPEGWPAFRTNKRSALRRSVVAESRHRGHIVHCRPHAG